MRITRVFGFALILCIGYVSGRDSLGGDRSDVNEIAAGTPLPDLMVNDVGDIPVNCMWCELAVDVFKKNLMPNVTSEGQLVNETTGLCMEILQNKTLCMKYGPMLGIALWTAKSMSSQEACELIKVCPASEYTEGLQILTRVGDMFGEVKQSMEKGRDIPVNCMWCQLAVHMFDENVFSHLKSEKELEKNLKSLCEMILPNNKTLCMLAAPQVAKYVWSAKTLSPMKACQMFKVCPKSAYMIHDLTARSGILCSACKDLIDVVKTAFLANIGGLENEVISLFCDHLPPAPMKACTSAIKQDLPGDIEKLLDPASLCATLKAC